MLTPIDAIDLKNSLIVTFDMSNIKKRLPHHMAFQIKSTYQKINIFQTMFYEGASTCVMSIACWKVIRSPQVVPFPTLLIAFYGHSHRMHGNIPAFPIYVRGKVVNIEVEIVNVNMDCNLLLGQIGFTKWMPLYHNYFASYAFPMKEKL